MQFKINATNKTDSAYQISSNFRKNRKIICGQSFIKNLFQVKVESE